MDECIWNNMYRLDSWTRERVVKSVRLLLPHLKEGETVSDYGCFTQFARYLLPKYVKYIGYDSFSYSHHTHLLDLDRPQSLADTDHALVLETLEHLKYPRRFLSSLAGIVRGFVIVSLPNEATLFHRVRSLLGTPDADAFSEGYKHLHLPNLKQARCLLSHDFDILDEVSYICPTACNSQSLLAKRILCLIPVPLQSYLASKFPSLFARGVIYLLKSKRAGVNDNGPKHPVNTDEPIDPNK